MEKSVLQLIQWTFEPDLPVLLHLSPLYVPTEEGTTPTLNIIQQDKNHTQTTDYYFSSTKPDPTVIPPHPENNDAFQLTQQQPEDPTLEDLPPLGPGEIRAYPSDISSNKVPVLDLTNTKVTSELDLCTAFHSLNVYQTDEQ